MEEIKVLNMVVENNETVSTETVTNDAPKKREFAPYRHASIRICRDCGKFYVMSDRNVLYYVKEYGTVPVRCEECRKRNRDRAPWPKDEEGRSVAPDTVTTVNNTETSVVS